MRKLSKYGTLAEVPVPAALMRILVFPRFPSVLFFAAAAIVQDLQNMPASSLNPYPDLIGFLPSSTVSFGKPGPGPL